MEDRRFKGSPARRPAVFLAVASGLLFFALPISGQDKVSIPQPPPGQPRDYDPPKLEPLPPRPAGVPIRRTSSSFSSFEELKKDVEQLQTANNQLQQAVAADSSSDNSKIEKYAASICELAERLQSRLWLAPSGDEQKEPDSSPVATRARVRALAGTLNESIKEFVSNPAAQQPRTVDARLLESAGLELERIIRQSAGIGKLAAALTPDATRTGKSASGAAAKRTDKLPPYLQLTLDCGTWTVNRFSDYPAKVENLWPITVEGTQVQVKHHKLLTEQIIFLDECVTAQAKQQAAASDERYAAAIKNFDSYEVKGRTFAYQATYQIVRTRGGKINARLSQLLTLYYTDEGGSGVFDLYEGAMPLRFLPDWTKELAAPRQK